MAVEAGTTNGCLQGDRRAENLRIEVGKAWMAWGMRTPRVDENYDLDGLQCITRGYCRGRLT